MDQQTNQPTDQSRIHKWFFTSCGLMAILIWASNVFFFKKTLDIYGYMAGSGLILIFSGMFGGTLYIAKNKDNLEFTPLNKHTLTIYACLISNNIFSSLSFGTAPENEVLLHIIIISDLWTLLTNLLLIKILHYVIRNRLSFWSGIIIGIAGIITACVGFDLSSVNFVKYFVDYYYCYFFAVITAIVWSHYSVYIKKYEAIIKDDHIFISALISGLIMIPFSFASNKFNNYDNLQFTIQSAGLMIYEVIVSCSLAYYLWNIGFKYGNVKTISNFSILAPLLNVCFTSAFYGLNMMLNIILGSVLLIGAALLCKHGMTNEEGQNLYQASMQNYVYKIYKGTVAPKKIGSANSDTNSILINKLISDHELSDFL